tara:strand:- start:28 stop:1290 length:1263 start_codon:yes stop_codon:yes gene_type:complete
MAAKIPVRAYYTGDDVTGLAEYQSGDFIDYTYGGTGLTSLGSAGQVLKVNSAGTALQFASTESILNIDGATDGTGITLVPTDLLLVSDNGTEKKINARDLKFNLSDESSTKTTIGITDTLTITGGSGIDTSVSQQTITVAGEDATTSNKGVASFSSDNFSVSSGAVTIKDSGVSNDELAGSISASKLAGSITNSLLSNSSFTLVDTSSTSTTISLGETLKIQGTSNEVEASVSGDTLTIGLPNNVTIAGNLTVSGTTTEVSSTTINVADPLLSMATNNNSSDAVDIGLYGLYDTSGSQDLYGGIFRDASDSGKWKIFKDLQAVPTTTVNTSGTGYTAGTLVAALEGNASTATTLETARTINNVSFNGSANIDIGSVTVGATSITSNLGSMALDSERLDVPVGFITINIGSTNYKMPYYSA